MRYEYTLLERRKVIRIVEDEAVGIPGFLVTLDCWHEFWMPVQPGETIHCSDCVARALLQLQGIQKEPIRADR